MADIREAARAAGKLTSQFRAMALVSEVLGEIADLDQARKIAISDKEAADVALSLTQDALKQAQVDFQTATRSLEQAKTNRSEVKADAESRANAIVAEAEKRARALVAEAQADVKSEEASMQRGHLAHNQWVAKAVEEKKVLQEQYNALQAEFDAIKARFK